MSQESDPVRRGLDALSQFFVTDQSVEDTLQRIVDLSVEAIERAEFAGLTMLVDGHPMTAVYSDPESPEIDRAQYESGSGPCMDAFREGVVMRLEDTESDERWPEFSALAAEHGVHSTISLPLIANGEALGALNLYARDPGRFSDQDERTGMMFTTQSAIVLTNAQAYWDARSLGENMAEAMKSRAVIEQAKGILMGSNPGISAEEAFGMLVKASQRENVKVRELAKRLVEHRTNLRKVNQSERRSGQPEAVVD